MWNGLSTLSLLAADWAFGCGTTINKVGSCARWLAKCSRLKCVGAFDLRVHDIDTARLLLHGAPTSIGTKGLAGRPINPVATEAVLIFADGGEARLVASRAAAERERRIAITYKCGGVSIDFIAKNFVDYPNFGLHADFAERIPAPICAATSDFVAAIFGDFRVANSTEDVAVEVHIAEAIQTASRASDQDSFESAKIYTRRLK